MEQTYKLIQCEDERDWLNERRKRIGASDVPSVLSISPYKSPLQLYHEFIGTIEPSFEETKRMRLGKRMEPLMQILYEQRFGVKLYDPGDYTIAVSENYPSMAATVDRLEEPGRINPAEFKGISEFQSGGYRDGILPEHHHAQAMAQALITGGDHATVYATVGDWEMLLWLLDYLDSREQIAEPAQYAVRVEIHAELAALIPKACEEFMWRVTKRIEPEADSSDSCTQTIKRLYAADNGLARRATDQEADLITAVVATGNQAEAASEAYEEARNRLRLAMGECAFIESGRFLVSNKTINRSGYTSVVKPSTYRTLKIKTKKEA